VALSGGKGPLADKIIELMPRHVHYVEPYFGGGAVLLRKDPKGTSEVVNDKHKLLTEFWRTLQVGPWYDQFLRLCQATPFSEVEWNDADPVLNPEEADPVVRVHRFFVRARQSLAGRGNEFAVLSRTRTRRGMNEQASAWLNAVEGLPAVHDRLKRVVVLDHDALTVIKQQDGKDTLFYCDPPYPSETRTAPEVYLHEMTWEDHRALLDVLANIEGKFMLSGYDNELYESYEKAHGWVKHTFDVPNHASGAKEKRRMLECLWCNFAPAKAPGNLFPGHTKWSKG
jgi:DNA adenine methylase